MKDSGVGLNISRRDDDEVEVKIDISYNFGLSFQKKLGITSDSRMISLNTFRSAWQKVLNLGMASRQFGRQTKFLYKSKITLIIIETLGCIGAFLYWVLTSYRQCFLSK